MLLAPAVFFLQCYAESRVEGLGRNSRVLGLMV